MDDIFVVRPFSTTSIGWWYAERDQIDLSPSYQRKSGVWAPKDKAYLIDSVINGYDMPKFYIADFSYAGSELNSANRPYAVIDGRQRFEAIFDFMDGRVSLNSDMKYLADKSIRLAGMTIRDMEREHPRIVKRIESFNLSVMSVITNQADRINDLFVRLNKSKPLTGAEVRSAMAGDVPRYIRAISNHVFFASAVGFSNLRKQHENVAAKLLILEHRGSFVETKKTNLDRFVAEAILTESSFAQSADRVIKNLDVMYRVFKLGNPLLKSSGMLPVYYWLSREFGDSYIFVDMLVEFERFRVDNKSHPAVIAFNSVSRSTNDEFSYQIRHYVLREFILGGGSIDANEFSLV